MKHKGIYTAAAIFLVAGLVFFFAGFSILDFDITAVSSENYTAKTEYFSGNIDEIIINDSNTNVYIYRTSGDLKLEYVESDYYWYEINFINGRLVIDKKVQPKIFSFHIGYFDSSLKIYIPSDFTGELNISTSNAKIDIVNLNGSVAEFTSSNGKIKMEDCKFDELVIKTSNASIEIENVVVEESVKLTSSNGKIILDTLKSESLKAQTSNSQISVKKVDCNSIDLKTSNGKISGTLPGNLYDYKITSKTSNGSNSLPSSAKSGSRELIVQTSNADIDIEFD